jgi:hypothetical protein
VLPHTESGNASEAQPSTGTPTHWAGTPTWLDLVRCLIWKQVSLRIRRYPLQLQQATSEHYKPHVGPKRGTRSPAGRCDALEMYVVFFGRRVSRPGGRDRSGKQFAQIDESFLRKVFPTAPTSVRGPLNGSPRRQISIQAPAGCSYQPDQDSPCTQSPNLLSKRVSLLQQGCAAHLYRQVLQFVSQESGLIPCRQSLPTSTTLSTLCPGKYARYGMHGMASQKHDRGRKARGM